MITEISSIYSVSWKIIWQSTFFLSVGLLLSIVFRSRSARAHRVLLLSITASVLVPAMTIFVKHLGLGLFEARSVEIQAAIEEPRSETSAEPFVFTTTQILSRQVMQVENAAMVEPVKENIEIPSAFNIFVQQNWRLILLFGWAAASLILKKH
jgi:hypothetical protein